MMVAGTKHACATCIRGHRSSSCTHSDRQLYEVRKKGRPVSQCPHCRDLRKIKSCHTRCACGENAGEQAKGSKCRCHDGQPCSCAGPIQVYQYIPPDRSSSSSTSMVTVDEARTPVDNIASMLHTFQADAQSIVPENVPSPSVPIHQYGQVQLQSQPVNTQRVDKQNHQLHTPLHENDFEILVGPYAGHREIPVGDQEQTFNNAYYPGQTSWQTFAPEQETSRPRKIQRRGSSSISKTTRSIGTNTEPLPPGIWPEDLFTLPEFMKSADVHYSPSNNRAPKASPVPYCCPKAKDMPLKDLGVDQYNLTDSTTPVPTFSTFYAPTFSSASDNGGTGPADSKLLSVDHYADDFDSEYFESLFDVPGCSLPGVQCRCGDGCSCAGCRTHKDNADHVAFGDFERMDFEEGVKAREHPAGCCDTRELHNHAHTVSHGVPAPIGGSVEDHLGPAEPVSGPESSGCCGTRTTTAGSHLPSRPSPDPVAALASAS